MGSAGGWLGSSWVAYLGPIEHENSAVLSPDVTEVSGFPPFWVGRVYRLLDKVTEGCPVTVPFICLSPVLLTLAFGGTRRRSVGHALGYLF